MVAAVIGGQGEAAVAAAAAFCVLTIQPLAAALLVCVQA
jgi:hypothetical protein